jgi:membrane fusion protein, multidrug efflux system
MYPMVTNVSRASCADRAPTNTIRRIAYAGVVLCAGALPATAQTNESAAIPVGTVLAERKGIEQTLEFVGRVDAIQRVEVRARVTGFLDAVLFQEGEAVTEGEPLYRIEKGLFEAAVQQAQGALERSKSAKTLTQIQLQRAEELVAKQAGTVVARDQARASDQQAEGAIMQDEANLKTAQINLGYTDIVSPIAGKVGKTNVTKGNVVGPNSGVLTEIVSQDPMYVTFPVSQREFLRARASNHEVDAKSIKARLRFADGSVYGERGQINFVDVKVDRTTDTILARAEFPNPHEELVDGQLVRVVLEIGAPQQQVVVPQSALLADQQGIYLFVIEDGKAVVRRIKTAGESGADVVVSEGLSGGEQVIVDRLQGVRPGTSVRGVPVQSIGGT